MCCSGVNLFTIKPYYECCKDRYRPRTTKCRSSSSSFAKLQRVRSSERETCYGMTYDPQRSICCESKVLSRSGGLSKCCIHLAYNPITHYCHMAASVLEKNPCTSRSKLSDGYTCCFGKRLMKRRGFECCRQSYRQSRQCTRISRRISYCSGNPYSKLECVCCRGSVYDKKRGYSCCNNGYRRVCISTRRFPTCGLSIYNREYKVCCGKSLYTKRPEYRCCSRDYYSVRRYTCSRGRVISICMNDVSTICCNNVAYHRTSMSLCCGDRLKNSRMHYCDGGLFRNKPTCHSSNIVYYNPNERVCCNNSDLYDIITDHRCCRHLYYNPNISSCIQGYITSL